MEYGLPWTEPRPGGWVLGRIEPKRRESKALSSSQASVITALVVYPGYDKKSGQLSNAKAGVSALRQASTWSLARHERNLACKLDTDDLSADLQRLVDCFVFIGNIGGGTDRLECFAIDPLK